MYVCGGGGWVGMKEEEFLFISTPANDICE